MANFVVKNNGNKVTFDIEKIKSSIAAAATDTGASPGTVEEIVGEVTPTVEAAFEGQEEVTSAEIKDKILSVLDEFQPATADAWRRYEETKGH